MPQIQILPSVPSFGSRLAQTLGQAGAGLAEAYGQRKQQAIVQGLLAQLKDPKASSMDKLSVATQIATRYPEAAKAILPLYAPLIYEEGQPSSQGQGMDNQQVPVQGEPITAATQPTGVQNAPSPTGQTESDIEARRKSAMKRVGLPYGIGDRAKEELADIREEKKVAAKERLAKGSEQRETERKEEEKIDTIQKDIVQGMESALVSEANLNRMEALKDSDQLISPLGAYLSNMFGVPVSLASGADTEEFQKLAAQRGLNVASAYGFGRILQTEFNNFLQTIPSLLNSKEGKERIIHTLRYFDNLAKARYDTYKGLLKERKPGERARGFELELSDRMRPFYDKFGEILKYGDELVEMKDPSGKIGKVKKSQIGEALANDYTLVENK